ncbi:MAG: hypothetical protein ACLS2V_12735 [Clostridium paraputrificum]|uniref:hypothetical protein n=1 Tax=Clostridium sp. TaxID=1506 RepID=UPI0025C46B5B|nr:hypothetical protein [Clostridium sp.]MBS5926130.1 hypothetical protein [Clostridium sp.]
MLLPIIGYENYYISSDGTVYNSKLIPLKPRIFKNTKYIRLYKHGKYSTLSINKLLFQQFQLVDKQILLNKNEVGIRYKNSHYYFTNMQRCYNAKTKRFLKPVIRNNYVSYSLCINKKKLVVYPLSYLKLCFREDIEICL